MDAQLKAKWVEALRSGKYEQCEGYLHKPGKGYCCLGVLADIQGAEWRGDLDDEYLHPKIQGLSASLRDEEHLVPEYSGGITYEQQRLLSTMNDAGASFGEIAAHIEAKL